MKTKVLEIILNTLSAAEDDLYRANMEFGKLSAKKLAKEYGESGLTCGEIFDVYKLEVARLKQCAEWLESLQEQPQIAYEKYEFCRSMNCPEIADKTHCDVFLHDCLFTAKRFHQWLQCHNFKIIKEDTNEHRTIE